MENFAPLKLKIFDDLLSSIAEEMGVVLGQTSYSPNIKERKDYSCSIFDEEGEMVAQAAHLPVHLGSMAISVKSAISKQKFNPMDMVILNDPFEGGTHLPDITLIAPVFINNKSQPDFFVANRAHHVDIGGMIAGSMPLSREIYSEGLRIPPVKIINRGKWNKDMLKFLLANVRGKDERMGDLQAQMTANLIGAKGIINICKKYGTNEIKKQMKNLQFYTENMMRARLNDIPDGEYSFKDYMDDDGFGNENILITVNIKINKDTALIDFTGSGLQVKGCINAVYAITLSCVFYVFRSLLYEEVPSNSGCLRPITLILPEKSIVNASFPSAVAGGNVETSQRIVDVLLGALSVACPDLIPAASCGSMNNLTIGGYDIFRNRTFSYYETIAGGIGAASGWDGLSGTHSHMTNTLNTPVEVLENYYPLRILRYEIAKETGGYGKYKGGNGIRRDVEVLCPADASVLSERRKNSPYGLYGGKGGKPGENIIISKKTKESRHLPSKGNFLLESGDIISIKTPGGGGYGFAK